MPVPSTADVHVRRLMTNMSLGFAQKETSFVADSAALGIPVTKKTDLFASIPRGEFNRIMLKKRASGSESAQATYKFDLTATYTCDAVAGHVMIDDDARDEADEVIDLDAESNLFLTQQALIYRENSWCQTFFKNGVWTGDVDGVAAGENRTTTFRQWSDEASKPIEDVRLWSSIQQERGCPRPNVLIVQRKVWDALLDHPDIVGRIDRGQTTGPAIANRDAVARLFELDEVLVCEGVQNTALEGVADVHAFVAGKHALLIYRPPTPGRRTPAAMYTFNWLGQRRQNAAQYGWSIDRWYIKERRADRMELNMGFSHKVISADCGFFFETAVA